MNSLATEGFEMDAATISANGQITLPVDVRRRLGLGSGDKVVFVENELGDTVVVRPSTAALLEAQRVFSGATEESGFADPAEVDEYVATVRAERRHRAV